MIGLRSRSAQTRTASTEAGDVQRLIQKRYKGFGVSYHYPHIVALNSNRELLTKDAHPRKPMVQRRYENTEPGLLWSAFSKSTAGFESGIVLDKSLGRLRRAFKTALVLHNLDWNGRKLDHNGLVSPNSESPIKGTMIFRPKPEILTTSNDELIIACSDHIEELLREYDT